LEMNPRPSPYYASLLHWKLLTLDNRPLTKKWLVDSVSQSLCRKTDN
jgi:hypothetical protein